MDELTPESILEAVRRAKELAPEPRFTDGVVMGNKLYLFDRTMALNAIFPPPLTLHFPEIQPPKPVRQKEGREADIARARSRAAAKRLNPR